MTTDFDAIVIGGGSAGLAFSKEAARRGASVLLIERDKLGGTCVNRGCVPKKMMWAVSDAMQTQAAMAAEGIFAHQPALDFAALAKVRANRISDIVESFDGQLEDAGVHHLVGDAVLQGDGKVSVDQTVYQSDRIVLATGTRPSPLDIEGDALMSLSDDVFSWTSVPDRLLVIGGGYIGCEMAAIFNGFGAAVTLVSDGEAVLTEFSEASQKTARRNLEASGVDVLLGQVPTKVTEQDGHYIITLEDGRNLRAERVLNATGRDPNLDVFADLPIPKQADNGALEVDGRFRTSMEGIYAIGDIANRLPLTPVAREDGEVLARQLFGAPDTQPVDLERVATTAFVFPPIGEVGRTSEMKDMTTFTAMESMLTKDRSDEGWALNRGTDGGLSGAAVVGHAAAEAVSWAGQAVAARLTRPEMDRSVAVHPSKAEEPLGADA